MTSLQFTEMIDAQAMAAIPTCGKRTGYVKAKEATLGTENVFWGTWKAEGSVAVVRVQDSRGGFTRVPSSGRGTFRLEFMAGSCPA